MTDFAKWYNELPPFTKHYMILCLVLTAMSSFSIVNYHTFMLDITKASFGLQLWRWVTSFAFFGNFSFHILMKLFLVYFACANTENSYTRKNMHDCVYMILLIYLQLIIVGWLVDMHHFLGDGFIFSLLYIWCKRNSKVQTRFMFGIVFDAAYLPFAILGYMVLVGNMGQAATYLLGLVIGHSFYFLKDLLPNSKEQKNRIDIYATPKWLQPLDFAFLNIYT